MQPAAKSLFWSAAILALVTAMASPSLSVVYAIDDTVQHTLAFGVLALLAALAYPDTRLFVILIGLSAFGGVIELLQMLPGIDRQAEWGDWLVDILATALTLGALVLARRLRTPELS